MEREEWFIHTVFLYENDNNIFRVLGEDADVFPFLQKINLDVSVVFYFFNMRGYLHFVYI